MNRSESYWVQGILALILSYQPDQSTTFGEITSWTAIVVSVVFFIASTVVTLKGKKS